MKVVLRPVLVTVILFLTVAVAAVLAVSTPLAGAQPTLQISLLENPFLCDTVVRPLGTVSGLSPGEPVEFSAPELNGVFSRRTADINGQVEMRWNCDSAKTWSISVRGLSSGATGSFTLTGKAAPPPPDAPIGAAFDAKSAMTAEQMAIWKDFSPFSGVGVYIDVNSSWDNRADKIQRNLTPSWVSTVFADGWSIIPIYVGFQAPDQCANGRFEGLSMNPSTAREQGLASAADAVDSMRRLGIGAGNPIYYDMEGYRPGCAEPVLAFLDAWTEGVRQQGYLSGVYGSRSSTMFDLGRALGRAAFDAPDAVWVSTGNGRPNAYGLEVPTDSQWPNARLHQYRLSITRTYGGVTREIDENIVDAPLARPIAQPAPTAVPAGGVDSDGDGVAEPEPDNCDQVANPDQADLDNDGDGDVCDRDIDGDGVDNVMDFAPNDPNVSSAPAPTAEPTPEPSAEPTPTIVDSDGDGVAEPEPDNCDRIANPDQADLDDDGDGDVCDRDIDGDGVDNEADQEPRDPFIGAAPEPTPEPTAAAEQAPTSEPEPTVVAEAPAEATATSVPNEPAESDEDDSATQPAEPADDAQVIVLPTSTPVPTPTPLPTAIPTSTPEPGQGGSGGLDEPPESIELAAETVTITIADENPLLPYLIAALSLFTMFCIGMGVRSFRHGRQPVV
jgi:hypothetical protein